GLLGLSSPPGTSPSLAVHSEHMHVTYPSPAGSSASIGTPKLETVTDPGGTAWSGSVVQTSATAAPPVSVHPTPYVGADQAAQAHPYGGVDQAGRAAGDVVFGYQIAVTPVGGEKLTSADWHWPLNLPGFPSTTSQYRDLYHDQNGTILATPYARSSKLSTKA